MSQNKLNKFYFLHIPKTGGRFINMNIINPLRPLLENKGIEIYPMGDDIYQPNHHNWNTNFIDDNTYIMTIFRDPAKRTVSHFIENERGAPDFEEKNNVEYFLNWVKENEYTRNFQSKSLIVEEEVNTANFKFDIDINLLKNRISKINLFLKYSPANLSFCHQIQSKIIKDFNINTEKFLYPINDKLIVDGFINMNSKQMFNKLNKKQINFLYENSSIDSEIYFKL